VADDDDRVFTAHLDRSNWPMGVEDSVRNSFNKHRAACCRERREEKESGSGNPDIWTYGHLEVWRECLVGPSNAAF
jgi:hypothetical protein